MAVKIPGLMNLENNTGAAVADGDGDLPKQDAGNPRQ